MRALRRLKRCASDTVLAELIAAVELLMHFSVQHLRKKCAVTGEGLLLQWGPLHSGCCVNCCIVCCIGQQRYQQKQQRQQCRSQDDNEEDGCQQFTKTVPLLVGSGHRSAYDSSFVATGCPMMVGAPTAGTATGTLLITSCTGVRSRSSITCRYS